MTPAARERRHVRVPVLCVSLVAWSLLVAQPGGTAHHAHHPALDWALMLAAMMAPLVIAPLRHVRDRSFAWRRMRAMALFAAGYGLLWLAAGAALLALAQAGRVAAPGSSLPVALGTAVALAWQFSPAKQSCLNRCRAHAELAAFGLAADVAALRFGLTHGTWCVGSCWALMLLPLLASRGHVAAMAAVALWLFAERLEKPEPPAWRWRVPGRAARLTVAQSRLRLQGG